MIVWLASYPKSGNTLLRSILTSYFFSQNGDFNFELLNKIDWLKICNGKPVNFHGDLHFENIVKSKIGYKLLDWRESFDDLINYGDIYYDFAKLNHGFIINHSLISENKFDVSFENNIKDALKKSDLIVVHTEWNDFKSINFKSYLKGRKPIIFDMRNIYSPTKMKQQGFKYFGVGR